MLCTPVVGFEHDVPFPLVFFCEPQMYDLGRKKLLRKCENKQMPTMVVSLTVTGDRVFAGDQMESCHCFKYRRAENQLVEFADDQVSPCMTMRTFLELKRGLWVSTTRDRSSTCHWHISEMILTCSAVYRYG